MHSDNLEKHTKEELITILQDSERSRQNLEFLLENINGISWEYNLVDNSFEYVSSNAERILGYKKEEWKNLDSWVNMLYEEDREATVAYCRDETNKGASHFMEYRMVKKSGEVIWVIDSVTLGKNSEGKAIKLYGFIIDISSQKKIQLELEEKSRLLSYQAQYDSLTQLPNRTLFLDRLEQGVNSAKRNSTSLALFFMDLDNFKMINDTMGHHIGDELLQAVSKRVSSVIRESDTFARLGGDEFTVILQNVQNEEDVSAFAAKIIKLFEEPFVLDKKEFSSSCSLGISIYRENVSSKELLKHADIAMYKAKSMGRNNFQFCTK